jgi:hypothetical protein
MRCKSARVIFPRWTQALWKRGTLTTAEQSDALPAPGFLGVVGGTAAGNPGEKKEVSVMDFLIRLALIFVLLIPCTFFLVFASFMAMRILVILALCREEEERKNALLGLAGIQAWRK